MIGMFNQVIRVLFLLLIMLTPACISSSVSGGLRLLVVKSRSELIVETKNAGGWGVASHPFLSRISSNRIAMTYNLVGDGKRKGNVAPLSWPAYYEISESKWHFGAPYVWQQGKPEDIDVEIMEGGLVGEKNPYSEGVFYGGLQFNDGRMINYARCAESPNYSMRYFCSSNWGLVWTDCGAATLRFPSEMGRLPSAMIIENEGVISGDTAMQVGYHQRKGDTKYSVFLFASDDLGKTYHFRSIVAGPDDAPWGSEGPCEPALVQLENGELLCLMRVGHDTGKCIWTYPDAYGDLLAARSFDGGQTWKHERTMLKGVMPKLLMMSNGVLVCAYGRPGNNLVFSLDGGKSWGSEMAITPQDVRTTGYLDMLEIQPGRLLVVYDKYDTDSNGIWLWEPKEVNGVFGVCVDAKRTWP